MKKLAFGLSNYCLKAWFFTIAVSYAYATSAEEQNLNNKSESKENVYSQAISTSWRSDEFGLIFSYDQRWKLASPTRKSTIVAINWQSRESRTLIGSCYIQANKSQMGLLKPNEIRENASSIAQAFHKNLKKIDQEAKMVSWHLATQNNHPVVFIEQRARIQNLLNTLEMTTYTIATAWKGYEVMFECGTAIPSEAPEHTEFIKKELMKILNTLQFTRGAS